ncbi:MAG: hypothetical protein RR342_00810 [Bacilli bacterium]
MKKLRVNVWKTELSLLLLMVVLFTLFYCSIGDIFNFFVTKNYIIIAAFASLTILFTALVPSTFKLEYNATEFYMTRFGKTKTFKFSEVYYIDDIYTKKHNALTYYTNKGKLIFISNDKDKTLLDIFTNSCKNTVTREQFRSKFPNISL